MGQPHLVAKPLFMIQHASVSHPLSISVSQYTGQPLSAPQQSINYTVSILYMAIIEKHSRHWKSLEHIGRKHPVSQQLNIQKDTIFLSATPTPTQKKREREREREKGEKRRGEKDEREIDRYRDRETERQRDREREREKEREQKKQLRQKKIRQTKG